MTEPTPELTIEEKILAEIESVEQQYLENNDEIVKLQKLLNQRLQLGVELKGQFKALKRLAPKPQEETEELPVKEKPKKD